MNERDIPADARDLATPDALSRAMTHLPMMICCALMVAGGAFVVFGSLRATGRIDWMGAVLPLALCGGMHLAMHFLLGRSCHARAGEPSDERASPATVPAPVDGAGALGR